MEYKYETMGLRIAKRRKSLKIQQNVLAELIGISNNHMSSIERGKETPSLDIFVAICNALKVTPDYLLMGSMHLNNVPENIIDNLKLCMPQDIDLVSHIVQYLVDRHSNQWNMENFI